MFTQTKNSTLSVPTEFPIALISTLLSLLTTSSTFHLAQHSCSCTITLRRSSQLLRPILSCSSIAGPLQLRVKSQLLAEPDYSLILNCYRTRHARPGEVVLRDSQSYRRASTNRQGYRLICENLSSDFICHLRHTCVVLASPLWKFL